MNVLTQAWDNFFEIKHAQSEEVQELLFKLLQDLQSIKEELAEYINTPSCNLPTSSFDDDDDEYSFTTQEYLMTCSTAITSDSPKMDSLIMVDKHLDIIPKTESDEFIKSSVENLVPTPSESEDASDDISIDSSPKIDSFLDEFTGELTLLKSIPPEIDDDNLDPEGEIHLVERLLYENSAPRPPEELNVENSIESFSPSPIPVEDSDSLIEGIDLFLITDISMPSGIENDDYDSEGDIFFLE
ncbi:hypothetical protein Tco_0531695 [Tanacetum coccineum]